MSDSSETSFGNESLGLKAGYWRFCEESKCSNSFEECFQLENNKMKYKYWKLLRNGPTEWPACFFKLSSAWASRGTFHFVPFSSALIDISQVSLKDSRVLPSLRSTPLSLPDLRADSWLMGSFVPLSLCKWQTEAHVWHKAWPETFALGLLKKVPLLL